MIKKITGRATIQLTVEINMTDAWGDDCSIGQLHSQASRSAIDKFNSLISKDSYPLFRVIGDPKVIGILTETGK